MFFARSVKCLVVGIVVVFIDYFLVEADNFSRCFIIIDNNNFVGVELTYSADELEGRDSSDISCSITVRTTVLIEELPISLSNKIFFADLCMWWLDIK